MVDKVIHEADVVEGIKSDRSGVLHWELGELRDRLTGAARYLRKFLVWDVERFKSSGVKRDE